MNLNNELDRDRLFRAMHQSYQRLEPFRELRRSLIEDYAGSSYGQSSASRWETVANVLNQAVDAYVMGLAANRPRVMVSTRSADLRMFADHFSIAMNNLIEEIHLESVLRRWVLEAFFCVGIVKTHLAPSHEVEFAPGVSIDPGSPSACNVSLDDWVHDLTADRYLSCRYAADCYRIPFDDLKDGIYDQSVVRGLRPSNRTGLAGATERVDTLSRGDVTDSDQVEDEIDLMDVWIRRENRVYTFAMNPTQRFYGTSRPLCDFACDEGDGPYELLSFIEIPDNVMPSSPASHLAYMSRLINNLLRKSAKQAKIQKTLFTFTPAGADAARRAKTAVDGDMIPVDDTADLSNLRIGGVDANNQAFLAGLLSLYDRMAGNLGAMAGLGPQAETLGQEQMIYGAVSKKEAHLKTQVNDATRRLLQKLAHMLWKDVAKTVPGRMPIPGTDGLSIDSTWTPDHRMGDFPDYYVDIDVYSMPYQTPAQKASVLSQLLASIYIPLGQVMMQQGGTINMQALAKRHADLLNLPELDEIIQFVGTPPDQQQAAQAGGGGMPQAPTTRNYVRRNVSTGGTPASQALQTQQAWLASSTGSQGGRPAS